jgi:type I restriction enzyme M protein
MVDPKLGEIVFDPACGTGGFLTCAFEHLKSQVKTPAELVQVKNSIRGVEKKQLPHTLCATNMMIHGIEVPSNILNDNTLAKPLRDYGPKDQVDVIFTNPPFGGVEEDGIENNFPTEFRTRETADLFLVLVMEMLREGGRAAIVLPDGTLRDEGIKTKIKKKMLEECNLHTIVRLPRTVFAPYTTITTNVLFITKGEPTKETWYFEHNFPVGVKAYSKSKPIKIEEFQAEKDWWGNRVESINSWKVPFSQFVDNGYNLDIKNPNKIEFQHTDPSELLESYLAASEQLLKSQDRLKSALNQYMGINK